MSVAATTGAILDAIAEAVTDLMPTAAMVTSTVVMTTVVSWHGAGAALGRFYIEP